MNFLRYISYLTFGLLLSACNGNDGGGIRQSPSFVTTEGSAIYAAGANDSRKSIDIITTEEEYNAVLSTFSAFTLESSDNPEDNFQGGAFDFETSQVVIVALGLTNTNETMSVESVVEYDDQVVVTLIYNKLAENAVATQVGYYPMLHIVIHSKKPIVIDEHINTIN